MRVYRIQTLAVASAVALFAAACSTSSSPSSTASTTPAAASSVVNLGFVADMQVPDPDIFYETEGNVVVTSVYQGLLQYAPNSTTTWPPAGPSRPTA
jgi:peptide/nickel transport system substrate-binding protein